MTDTLTNEAARLVERRLGFVIPRLYHERLKCGLERAQGLLGAKTPTAALAALAHLPVESAAWQGVIDIVTVGETNFLRHPIWFNEIKHCALAPLIEAKRAQGRKRLDLWSAGCSTGDEPYTLAMMVSELIPDKDDWAIRILATDIDAAALERAKTGHYRSWALRELAPDAVRRWFAEAGHDHYAISPELKEMVEFRMLNLRDECYPDGLAGIAQFDLILCRNVLIYLSDEIQRATAQRLAASLAEGGWLSVSPAEAIADWYRPLVPVNRPGAIFFLNDPVQAKALAERHSKSASLSSSRAKRSKAHAKSPSRRKTAAETKPRASSASAKPAGKRAPSADAAHSPAPLDDTPIAAGEANASDLQHARALADAGQYAESRQVCEALLSAGGARVEAYLLLTTVCLEMNEPRAALEAVRCAIYVDPDCGAAHYLYGSVLNQLGASDQARRRLAVAVQLLEHLPGEQPAASHFDATAGELCERARGFLAELAAA